MNRKIIAILLSISLIFSTGIVAAAFYDFTRAFKDPEGGGMNGGEHVPSEDIYVIGDQTNFISNNYDHVRVFDENFNKLETFNYFHGGSGSLGGIEYKDGLIHAIAGGDNTNGDRSHLILKWHSSNNTLTQVSETTPNGLSTVGSSISGLEWDGSNWWITENNAQNLYKLPEDMSSATTIDLDSEISGPNTAGYLNLDGDHYMMNFEEQVIKFNSTFDKQDTFNIPNITKAESMMQNKDTGEFIHMDEDPSPEQFKFYEGKVPLAFQTQYNVSGFVLDRDQNGIQNATITNNQSAVAAESDASGAYEFTLPNGTYKLNASKSGFTPHVVTAVINGSDITVDFRLLEDNLRFNLITQNYMPHGSEQPYKVEYVKVTDNGKLVSQFVTDQTNITSGNTSIVTVNQSRNILIATDNRSINARVDITATFTDDNQTFTDIETITVANLTIDNIDIMPGTQFFNAFMSTGAEGNSFGMGSDIQWLFLVIILGATVGLVSKNEWAGLGSMNMALIIFWIMGNISVGITISGVLFSIAMSLVLLDIPSRTNVNIETDNFNEESFDDFENFEQ